MAAGDLIDFDVIEGQKENIQALPGGRSAKKLAEIFSPSPLHKLATPTPTDSKNINDCIRAEYEAEVAAISESDDPLDVFDRYVRWTFDAYPSAQATPQSQLHTLLERATKAFIGSTQYKNDPRYLKLWLHYIHFFSDSPRETFVFLARHSIGESLAIFYEEYAAWLESAKRWSQAEEVYKLGIEREARPVQRLIRKFGEFERRRAEQPDDTDEPSSPALPTVRPALAAKVDPFAAPARPVDPQAPRPNMGVGGQSSSRPTKSKSSKLAIFSDASSTEPAMPAVGEGPKGWDTIGSLADRKKENVMEAKPWVGETLKTSVKKSSAPKMAVFRDPSLARIAESHIVIAPSKHQVIVNPQNGKRERVYVSLEAVYPTPEEPGTELSFEELWAANRGWLDACWDDESLDECENQVTDENAPAVEIIRREVEQKLVIHRDAGDFDENGTFQDYQAKPAKGRKKKVMEVNETQIIKANLDSPSGPKIKKKRHTSSEPTMTMHTKAATDEIYELFNAPLKPAGGEEGESDEDEYMSDGDYTSGGESTVTTTRRVGTSEAGDDETVDDKSVSGWSDFTARKHIPNVNGDENGEYGAEEDDDDSAQSDIMDSDEIQQFDHEEEEDSTPTPVDSPPKTRIRFIPIPPVDYEPPTRPYRDPAEVANNRLPFMTPITERTETSLGMYTDATTKSNYYAKTPCKMDSTAEEDEDEDEDEEEEEEDDEDFGPLSSPLREVSDDTFSPVKLAQPQLLKPEPKVTIKIKTTPSKTAITSTIVKGPIITEPLCNPVDAAIREVILAKMHPPLSSYTGFYDHRSEKSDRGTEIRRFAKAAGKGNGSNGKTNGEKTGPIHSPVVLEFPELMCEYTMKRELGSGAFAPVYLVENSAPENSDNDNEKGSNDENDGAVVSMMGKGAFATRQRASLEALKMEHPPTAWEFAMMRLAADRLGPRHRATASVSPVHELHLYRDEGFLILPFHPYPTLLGVVNFFREQQQSGSGVMDEPLAMFFTIELLRTVEALHAKQILHGDLKVDNCLLRLDDDSSSPSFSSSQSQGQGPALSTQYSASGAGGWSSRGIVLIDFGRAIDMRAYLPSVQFVADWKTSKEDCAEVREGRPWTWQLDYHGLAGIAHCLLFGRYIETVRADTGGLGTAAGRRYKIRENLKRYWQTDIWGDFFDVLLNPGAHALNTEPDGKLPVNRALRGVRERMEVWLEMNCEKGIGLRALMGRVETWARSKRH
ncbi:Mad3/BUB1 homology region 1-domain-containing protein [Nemania sp. FL0916]|nr:Mad3/BUB1 homology region 1-domain-containing protein [Nemania sp. FL0916]